MILMETELRSAAERSRAYRALARAFSLPDRSIYEEIVSRGLAEALRPGDEDLARRLKPALSFEEFQAEYLRLFEVGTPRPPCPLYEGAWREREFPDRRELMEELVRFYNFFGLTLGAKPKELPDHLAIELEFMHFLAYQEARALEEGCDPGSYRRAQRDFLERHLLRWLPRLRKRLEREETPPFFPALIRETVHRVERDHEELLAAFAGLGRAGAEKEVDP